jgi:hypothetical protein
MNPVHPLIICFFKAFFITVAIRARVEIFYLLHIFQINSTAYPGSHPMGNGGSFTGGKVTCE